MRALLVVPLLLVAAVSSAQLYSIKETPAPGKSRVPVNGASTNVRINQNIGEFLPGDVVLINEEGRQVRFEELQSGRPIILTFLFYKCDSVCLDTLFNLSTTLRKNATNRVGVDYDIITVSINPKEKPIDARSAKMRTLDTYKYRDEVTQKGWHFLVGDEANVRKLADAAGFKYEYDAKSGNIVHPAGIIILTPQQRVSRYFLGVDTTQYVLIGALKDAQKGETGVRDDRPFFMSCINIDPLTGQRTLNILNTVRVAGIVTVLGIITYIVAANMKGRKPKNPEAIA